MISMYVLKNNYFTLFTWIDDCHMLLDQLIPYIEDKKYIPVELSLSSLFQGSDCRLVL
jgi:hypothetical protein